MFFFVFSNVLLCSVPTRQFWAKPCPICHCHLFYTLLITNIFQGQVKTFILSIPKLQISSATIIFFQRGHFAKLLQSSCCSPRFSHTVYSILILIFRTIFPVLCVLFFTICFCILCSCCGLPVMFTTENWFSNI